MRTAIYTLTVIAVLALPSAVRAKIGSEAVSTPRISHQMGEPNKSVDDPYTMSCTHDNGNVWFCTTNFGQIGSQYGSYYDCISGEPAPGFEFPGGSDIEYLFFGGLWVGAIVGQDTLVSVGIDGWQWLEELWPCAEGTCGIEKRSRIPLDPYYHPDAVSDLDQIAEYTDTLTDQQWVGCDFFRGCPHIPLNLRVSQRSFSWQDPPFDDFVIVEYTLSIIGSQQIDDAYVGILVDADIGHTSNWQMYIDDITGHRAHYPEILRGDSIRYAWFADNDGDPQNGSYNYMSPTGALAISFLGPNAETDMYAYNWWESNGNPAFDWGPWLADNAAIFDFLTNGGLGTPEGDRGKFFMMSNNEIDYDQIFCAEDHGSDGWLPPPPIAQQLASGSDIKGVISMGPVDITPDQPFTFAVVFCGGEDLHVDPTNNIADNGPYEFYSNLDFDSTEYNLTLAHLLYRNNYRIPEIGDANFADGIDVDDVVFLIDYVFSGGPEPVPYYLGDANCSGTIDIDDITYLIQYVFAGGPKPGDIDDDGEPDC